MNPLGMSSAATVMKPKTTAEPRGAAPVEAHAITQLTQPRMMTLAFFQLAFAGTTLAAALICAPPSAWAQTDPKASADEHFKKGVAAFKERRFGDAAPEFEEPYRLSPAYVVLSILAR